MIGQLIGKAVMAAADDIKVHGRFVGYYNGSRLGHIPSVLILEDQAGQRLLMRGWTLIAVTGEKT